MLLLIFSGHRIPQFVLTLPPPEKRCKVNQTAVCGNDTNIRCVTQAGRVYGLCQCKVGFVLTSDQLECRGNYRIHDSVCVGGGGGGGGAGQGGGERERERMCVCVGDIYIYIYIYSVCVCERERECV